MKFDVFNWFTGAVQFTAEIDCADDVPTSVKIGLAVRWAIKSGADLSRADLSRADLSGADLSGADLSGADISGADLYGADLSRANLYGANISGANLSGADLYGANLSGADLSGADLSRANLSGANLSGAENADLVIARTRILPDGDLIGWKKCKCGAIVKLRIPEAAKRSHAFGRKCRAEYADVLDVIGAEVGVSTHDGKTEYRAGQRVTCHEWSDNWQDECAGGIHFYITRAEAEAHR
jgi:hypothetical protein